MFTKSKITDYLIFAVCLTFSAWLMCSTLTYKDNSIQIDSKLWSDFAAHIPLVRTFSMGDNFPPEYPTFPGEPIRYHYLFYLMAGLLEKTGLNIATAINLPSIIGFTLLLWMIYQTTRLLFKSVFAGIISLFLFLFNGSLSWIRYFGKYGFSPGSFLSIPNQIHFVSFGPWDGGLVSAFNNLNIYTNQRHLGLSFGLILLIMYPFLYVLKNQKSPGRIWWFILAPLMFILPFIHQAAFIIVWIVVVGISFINISQAKLYFPLVFALSLGSLPGILLSTSLHSQAVIFEPGYLIQNLSPHTFIEYWFHNLGLYLPFLPLIILLVKKPGRIFFIALIPLFIIANLFRLSPDMINNHKLINFFSIGLSILAAGTFARLYFSSLIGKLSLPFLIIGLTFSGIIDIFPISNDYALTITDLPKNSTALWISRSTPKTSIFLTTTYLYNPAGISGRKTFEDYGYFNWSMGYNDHARRQELNYLYSPNLPSSIVCSYLVKNHIDYILISQGDGDLGTINPHMSTIATTFTPTYQSDTGDTVYAVKQNCP